jgi:hypothetical protein
MISRKNDVYFNSILNIEKERELTHKTIKYETDVSELQIKFTNLSIFSYNYINYKTLGHEDNDEYTIKNFKEKNNGKNIFSLSKSQINKCKYSTKRFLYKVVKNMLDQEYINLIESLDLHQLEIKTNYQINFKEKIFINFEFINDQLPLYLMVRRDNEKVSYFRILKNVNDKKDEIEKQNWLCATPCLWQYKLMNKTLIDWLNNLPLFDENSVENTVCYIINKSDTDEKIIKKYYKSLIIENFQTISTDVKGFFQEVTPIIN